MKIKNNQKGFEAIGLIAVVVIIGLIGAVGWLVYDRQKSTDKEASTSTNSQQITQSKSEDTSSTEPKDESVLIKEWDVKVSQPLGQTIVISKPSGQDFVTGALSGVYVYLPKYDKNYTCDSSQGETNKAQILIIQKFSSDSNIESNTKNKPYMVKTAGGFKYGIYKPFTDCYDSSTSSTIQSITQSYLENITITAN